MTIIENPGNAETLPDVSEYQDPLPLEFSV